MTERRVALQGGSKGRVSKAGVSRGMPRQECTRQGGDRSRISRGEGQAQNATPAAHAPTGGPGLSFGRGRQVQDATTAAHAPGEGPGQGSAKDPRQQDSAQGGQGSLTGFSGPSVGVLQPGRVKMDTRARTLTEGRPQATLSFKTKPAVPNPLEICPCPSFQGFFSDLRGARVTSEDVLELTAAEKGGKRTILLLVVRYCFDAGKNGGTQREKELKGPSGRTFKRPGSRGVGDCICGHMAVASNKEEFAEALLKIKDVLEVGKRFKELLVVGDQQTWKHMDELKNQYRVEFGWLLHMPGDWHTLLNAQAPLKKMFLHAGLQVTTALKCRLSTYHKRLSTSMFRSRHH
jgi:hypothetical protein